MIAHEDAPAFQVHRLAALLLAAQEDWDDARRDAAADPEYAPEYRARTRTLNTLMNAWHTLTGTIGDDALALARKCRDAGTVAHAAPF